MAEPLTNTGIRAKRRVRSSAPADVFVWRFPHLPEDFIGRRGQFRGQIVCPKGILHGCNISVKCSRNLLNGAANASYSGVTSGKRRPKFLIGTRDFRRRSIIDAGMNLDTKLAGSSS